MPVDSMRWKRETKRWRCRRITLNARQQVVTNWTNFGDCREHEVSAMATVVAIAMRRNTTAAAAAAAAATTTTVNNG
jgi:hypothetical protein